MSETTQDSVNARIMQLLHPTWTNMGGYFNDGAGHGYVTPDFAWKAMEQQRRTFGSGNGRVMRD